MRIRRKKESNDLKIIDAHLHFADAYHFNEIAAAAGHQNNEAHLLQEYRRLGMVHGVVMGNRELAEQGDYPAFLSYCAGLDSHYLQQGADVREAYALVEQHLRRPDCVGLKLYPGYCSTYVSDPLYHPFYELARSYHKSVAIHTGATATSDALLKYCHPLTLDELAVQYPDVQFVMCHFGNPFLADAAAVLSKNPNVSADLSGMLEGRIEMDSFFAENSGYVDQLRTWLRYAHAEDRLMFGTDWPLANLGDSIAFVRRLLPERWHERIFADNAIRIYQLEKRGLGGG